MTRTEIITTLLNHLTDYEQPPGRTGQTGDGGPALMPPMWHHPSVRELYRTLDRLRHHDHTAWAHTTAHYRSEWRTTDTRRRARNRNGALIHPLRWEPGPRKRERITNPWIEPHVVERGTKWIITHFHGEPFLPDELRTELVA